MRAPPALRLMVLHLRGGVPTVDWPRIGLGREGPPRGLPEFSIERCTACGECVSACPSRCITLPDGEPTPLLDAGPCTGCAACVSACEEGAVTLTGPRDLATLSRGDLVRDGSPPAPRPVGPPPGRLYRMAVRERGRGSMLSPDDLLEARRRSLARREER